MAKMNLQNLSDSERKLIALTMAHIGSNGDAHLPATTDQAGFMSADDKYQLDAKGDYARGLSDSDNLDILTLGFGKFVARNFINAPSPVDDSVCLVEIVGNSLWKRIRFDWIAAGKTYDRYIYSTLDSGWISSDWVSISPLNGFTGTINARRISTPNSTLVEVRVNIQNSSGLTNGAITQIGTLPSTFGNAGVTPYWTIPAQSNNTNCTINAILQSGTAISVFRNETNSAGITKIFGSLMYGI